MQNSPALEGWHAIVSFTIVCSAALISSPLAAQDDASVTAESAAAGASEDGAAQEPPSQTPPQPPRQTQFRRTLDLSVTVPREETAELLQQDCEREADVGKVQGEIVVCRQLGEGTDGVWNKGDYERRLAERTQGEKPVNTFGLKELANSISFGSVPDPVLMIDVEALPQAPEGSDADRIARGLPPLGQEEELSPEEIQRRRRAAGLDAPDLPGQ